MRHSAWSRFVRLHNKPAWLRMQIPVFTAIARLYSVQPIAQEYLLFLELYDMRRPMSEESFDVRSLFGYLHVASLSEFG